MRKVALVRQAVKDAPENFDIVYGVIGPDAFGEMLREVGQQIAPRSSRHQACTIEE